MGENAALAAQEHDAAFRAYVQDAAGNGSSPSAELDRLADLRSRGVIDEPEFARLKQKVVSA
jgi:hypothetical protein